MGFNHGLEKKSFDSQWAVTRKQYEDAGMSSEAIQAMYDYDAKAFKIALVPSADRSMDTCTVCQMRRGYDYVVMHR